MEAHVRIAGGQRRHLFRQYVDYGAGFGHHVERRHGGNYGSFGTGSNPYNSLSAAYKAILTGGDYTAAATPVTVTLNGLVSGHTYLSQVWVIDARSGADSRTETVTGGGGNTVTLDYTNSNSAGGLGQFSIGRFAANATTQALTLTGNSSTQLNAIQVRDVTNIGAWVGTGAISIVTPHSSMC